MMLPELKTYLTEIGYYKNYSWNKQAAAVRALIKQGWKFRGIDLEVKEVIMVHREHPLMVYVGPHKSGQWSNCILKYFNIGCNEEGFSYQFATRRFEGQHEMGNYLSLENLIKTWDTYLAKELLKRDGVNITNVDWFEDKGNKGFIKYLSTHHITKEQAFKDWAAFLQHKEYMLDKLRQTEIAMIPVMKELFGELECKNSQEQNTYK